MDESWLQELNKRNIEKKAVDVSEIDYAIVSLSSSVLKKLSKEEQQKFEVSVFKRATNEIEYWSRVEEICEFFGVEDPELAGDIYVRRFKNLTLYDQRKWQDLKDFNEIVPEGFGVKVDWCKK